MAQRPLVDPATKPGVWLTPSVGCGTMRIVPESVIVVDNVVDKGPGGVRLSRLT